MRRLFLAGLALAALALAPPAAASAWIGGVAADVPSSPRHPQAQVAGGAGLNWNGGTVLHSNRTHLVFWEPYGTGLSFSASYMKLVEGFVARVASASHLPSNVYGLTGQYYDSYGHAVYSSSYAGAVIAHDGLPRGDGCVESLDAPPTWHRYCVNDDGIRLELSWVRSRYHLPATGRDIYFLLTPEDLGSCFNGNGPDYCALGGPGFSGYCGYHSSSSGSALYAVLPYNAEPGHCQSGNPRPNSSPADPTISTLSHEHNETITDPFGTAWTDSSGSENGDLCLTSFGPAHGGSGATSWNQSIAGGHYWLQEEWSNQEGGCRQRDETDAVAISAPAQAKVGQQVSFTASGHDPDGRITAFAWRFGDGASAWGSAPRHTFSAAGRYRVVVKSIDSIGDIAYAARMIQITG